MRCIATDDFLKVIAPTRPEIKRQGNVSQYFMIHFRVPEPSRPY